MSKSKKSALPGKPYDGFPLFPHQSNRWCKKIRGHQHYFGKILPDDPKGEQALQRYLDQRDDLHAGRKPRPKCDESLTVESLINAWLHSKRQRVDTGELSLRTWQGYKSLGLLVVENLGRTRAAADVHPADFAALRTVFSKRWGPGKLATAVTHTRSIWKWGFQSGLLATQTRFGEDFAKPSAKSMRQARNAKGPRMFQPSELHGILDVADVRVRAMTLLGVQAGIGNTDLALLQINALDLPGGWLTLPRAKTGIVRRIPLWSETVDAIRAVLDQRPEPKRGNEDYLFLTPTGGNYICGRYGTAISLLFRKAAEKAGVTNRTFYDCRRTFQTVADGARDPVATSSIMGHAPRSGDMASVYRQTVADDRLQAVVKVVHDWLFGSTDDGGREPHGDDRQDGRKQRQDAPQSTRVQQAIVRFLQAIESASEADRLVLRSVWNSSEISLALSGDTWTVKRFLDQWGDAPEERPALRIVG